MKSQAYKSRLHNHKLPLALEGKTYCLENWKCDYRIRIQTFNVSFEQH